MKKIKEITEVNTMKDILKKRIVDCINTWTEAGIYALVLDVCDLEDEPSVMLRYNTEVYCQCPREEEEELEEEFLDSKNRLRWDCGWWNQHEEMWFGDDEDTAEIVRQWIRELGGLEPDLENPKHYDDVAKVYDAFEDLLAEIVMEIHEEKVLTKKFGRELPILIHEFPHCEEYTEEVVKINIKANGEELVKDFVEWIRGINARGIYI